MDLGGYLAEWIQWRKNCKCKAQPSKGILKVINSVEWKEMESGSLNLMMTFSSEQYSVVSRMSAREGSDGNDF